MKQFYIADWHFDHNSILNFDNRPFNTVGEMNKALISRWNDVVGRGDIVYILGDMFWCNATRAIPILDNLKGKKYLIRGNHDSVGNKDFAKKFAGIYNYLEIKDGDRNVVLCHYPIPCFKKHFSPNWYHFYGHVHETFEYELTEETRKAQAALGHECKMYNVGVMLPYMDYTPRTFDEIIGGANDLLR